VIAIIALLAALLLPALGRAKGQALAIKCMNNMRQLTIAFFSYATDNEEEFPPAGKWVGGRVGWNDTEFANEQILLDPVQSPLGPYVGSAGIFKCPADKEIHPTTGAQRVRSMSLNAVFGGELTLAPAPHSPLGREYVMSIKRMSDLVRPGPAETFAFVDEHPDSINDAEFHFVPGLRRGQHEWRDLPASFHYGGGANFSFADGHCEIKKWQSGLTKRQVEKTYKPWGNRIFLRDSPDYEWLNEHMPYR
jgi:prepilin-type processing-associated H-X9-DG protein